MTTVLFLDDNPDRHAEIARLYAGETVVNCYTVDQFTDALSTHDRFDVVSLDHDLNDFESKSHYMDREATGLDACGLMCGNPAFRAKLPQTIVIHSVNPCGAVAMRSFLQNRGLSVKWIPFSVSDYGEP